MRGKTARSTHVNEPSRTAIKIYDQDFHGGPPGAMPLPCGCRFADASGAAKRQGPSSELNARCAPVAGDSELENLPRRVGNRRAPARLSEPRFLLFDDLAAQCAQPRVDD